MRTVEALGLRVGLRHVLPLLGLAVVFVTLAVIDLAGGVDPHLAGTALVRQAGTTIGEVVSSVARVTEIMSEISAAGREQSAGIDQVNVAITQMDQMTQQNAALVEEAAAAAASMQEQSAHLEQMVGHFRLAAATPAPTHSALTATAHKRLTSAI